MTDNAVNRIYVDWATDGRSRPSRPLPAPQRPGPSPARLSTTRTIQEVATSANANSPTTSPTSDERMLQVLTSAPMPGETLHAAFHRKEQELRQLFDQLTVLEARALHRRLTIASADDQLAASFGRLVIERRGRLLGFLADARRREAIGRA